MPAARPTSAPGLLRLGCVSFLNARPLIHGLEQADGIDLALDVPSRLLDGLSSTRYDVALLPVVDYQRLSGLQLLTSGGIASDGPTLTVRIFSPCPIEQIQTLACDTDSHSSVALARIILGERYGVHPELVPLHREVSGPHTAKLLIGDKVVCESPANLPHQLDLGEAWKRQTDLPFAFAVWTARSGVELGDLPHRLEEAKRTGRGQVNSIIERFAIPRGWPPQVAREYLTRHLEFDIGPKHLEAIRSFHSLAFRYGIIPHEPWELQLVTSE